MVKLSTISKLYPLTILLFVIAAVSIFLNINFYQKIQSQNTVTEVVDGDTFQLSSGKRVRLMGVNAPEFDRYGGKEAKERLSELILDKSVILKEETDEAYGRSLALVYVDNIFVNKTILEEGWGRTDYRKNSQRDILTAGDCVIKGNIDKNSYDKFYHLPGCLHYDEVVIEQDIGEGFFVQKKKQLKPASKKPQVVNKVLTYF